MSSCNEWLKRFIKSSQELGECRSRFFLSQMGNGSTAKSECDQIKQETTRFLEESINNGANEEAQQLLKGVHADAESDGYKQQGDPLLSMHRQLFASIIRPVRESRANTYCDLMTGSESPKV